MRRRRRYTIADVMWRYRLWNRWHDYNRYPGESW
jgi:hypothetical protein